MIDPDSPVSTLPAIGTAYTQKLAKLGITIVKDLLYHFPVYYQDTSQSISIDQVQIGETVTLTGAFDSLISRRISGNRTMQIGNFSDGTGQIQITWFNQPFLVKSISQDHAYHISGTVKQYRNQPSITAPQYELASKDTASIHTKGLIPQYRQTAGVSSKWLRRQLHNLLHTHDFHLQEFLPTKTREHHQLQDITTAIKNIHFPEDYSSLESAKKRLAFQEVLLYQLAAYSLKSEWADKHQATPLKKTSLAEKMIRSLPFQLTSAQKKCISEISRDLSHNTPMHRLLQGDVGAGKTIVAAAAALISVDSGFQTLFMVPTQVLAQQHYQTFQKLCQPLGISVGLLTATTKDNHHDADILIGTHSLLHQPFADQIGLVIIDEQHRFGVEQRSTLLNTNPTPHLLSLTATPIPRTIALSLYAQIDISYLDEFPQGRVPIKTKFVPQKKREIANDWIRNQIKQKQAQVFYVCPLIEESTTPKLDQVKSVTSQYQLLSDSVFKDCKIGLLHGQMKSNQKQLVLDEFHAHKIDILVSTPVIEVGVDVKNATIMVIESAERFGLASLHQLRGRVGRSDKQSYCFLFSSTSSSNQTRLKHLETINQGSKLAEIDLEIRGPGHLFGTQQSGYIDLKIASLTDMDLIQTTHREARRIVDSDISKYPELANTVQDLLDKLSPSD